MLAVWATILLPAAFAQSYWIDRVAGNPSAANDGAPARSALLINPNSVAVDGFGNLYIADHGDHRIRKVDATGLITTVAGNGHEGFSGDGGPAENSSLNRPHGVALDGVGNLYIADGWNHRIRKVDAAGTITTIAGNGSHGFGGDGGPAIDASLAFPAGIALDGVGNLYIADGWNHRIRKVDAAGTITTIGGNGSLEFSGDGGPAIDASLGWLGGIAVDGFDNLYVADESNHRIRKVDAAGTITTVAGNGHEGFSGDGGPAADTSLASPRGVAVDTSGNLYIADTWNHRIRKVDAAGTITTVAGGGGRGHGGDCGPAPSAEIMMPLGVGVDRSGGIYFADGRARTVRKLSVGAASRCTATPTALPEWTVSPSQVVFGGSSSAGCLTLDAPISSVSYVVHTSEWQRRTASSSAWSTVGGTLRTGRICAFQPTEPGQYRAVAEISVGSSGPAVYRSANVISGASDAENGVPAFGATISDQNYVAGTAISLLTLPTASGGDMPLVYSLGPSVPGLAFNAWSQQLSGTPTSTGTYSMRYTVSDSDGDSASLRFTITVQSGGGSGGEKRYRVNERITTMPTGLWAPDVTSDGSFQYSQGTATVRLDSGGYIAEGDYRYTCESSGGCEVVDRTVVKGVVIETSTDGLSSMGDDHGDERPAATSLILGTQLPGRFEMGGDVDYFRLRLSESTSVAIYTTGSLDTYGQLEDASGRVVAWNDDGGESWNFRIEETLSAGAYYVRVRSVSTTQTGSYRLHAERAAGNGSPGGGSTAPPSLTNSIGMEFALVPAGEFDMGSTSDEASSWEQPVTRVRISRAFYMGKHEVTQGQWEAVMGSKPSQLLFADCGADCPVEGVSWYDVQEFVQKLNEEEGEARYRLPTEAEWEYAARAGTTGDRYSSDLDSIAWYSANSGGRTHPVGRKQANGYGLYDMLGNVFEWVQDWFWPYPGGSVTDPAGPSTGSERVYRGGDWGLDANSSRATSRSTLAPDLPSNGFRLARTVEGGGGEAPDLVVESPSVSDSTLAPGTSFSLSATVRNAGNGLSAATTLRYYQSSDSAISSDDTEVGTGALGALGASGASIESTSLTAPSSVGTHYYGACVDAVSNESNTGNNCSGGVQITVSGGTGAPVITSGPEFISEPSIDSNGDGQKDTYGPNEIVSIRVGFSEQVCGSGDLALSFQTGSGPTVVRNAEYCGCGGGISGIKHYVYFCYQVDQGDRDGDGLAIATNAISLRSYSGVVPNAEHEAVPSRANHRVDGSRSDESPPSVGPAAPGIYGRPLAGDTYRRGETIRIEVTFTKNVVVNTSGGLPTVGLEIGGNVRRAQYAVEESESDRLVFTYTVQAGDRDTDGEVWVPADSLILPAGSSIKDLAGNDALLSWSVSSGRQVYVDGSSTPADQRPRFGSTRVSDQSFTVGKAIAPLTLPEASGGDGTLTYSLVPEVPGLTFSAPTRMLSGTPSSVGSYAMTYTAADVDGDTDTLSFSVSVTTESPPADGNDSDDDTRFNVGDTISDMPSGFWVPSLTETGKGASFVYSGGTVTLAWKSSGGIIRYTTFSWTCDSSGGCEVINGKVTKGTVVQSTTGG